MTAKLKSDISFYEFIHAEYTRRFTHTDMERQPDGTMKLVKYEPFCVVSYREIDVLSEQNPNMTTSEFLDLLRARVGQPGMRFGR